MQKIEKPFIPENEFNILDFGVERKNLFRIDEALKKAINAARESGGGKIVIPSGRWESGPIHLENNIEIHFEDGAEIYFSMNLDDYLPAVFSRHQGIECYKFSPLIYANGINNFAITGNGILHGRGKAWWKYNNRREKAWMELEQMARQLTPVEERIFADTTNHFLAPSFFQPINCKNIFIEGVTFNFGPFWTVNPVYCENVIIRKVKVVTQGEYGHTQNGDGINPSSCKNVLIEYCDLDTGDDCITIKSGRAEDGLRVGKPSENIVIRYCEARQGHGGVVIGSETSGGIKNVFIHQCSFHGTDRGIRIKTARERGAAVENIFISDITMENIKDEAIVLNMLRYTPRLPEHPVSIRTPEYNNITISNVICKGAEYGIRLIGLPEKPMKNIHLKNIQLASHFGLQATDVTNLTMKNVIIESEDSESVVITDCQNLSFEKLYIKPGKSVNLYGNMNRNLTFKDCGFTQQKNWLINNKTSTSEIKIQ